MVGWISIALRDVHLRVGWWTLFLSWIWLFWEDENIQHFGKPCDIIYKRSWVIVTMFIIKILMTLLEHFKHLFSSWKATDTAQRKLQNLVARTDTELQEVVTMERLRIFRTSIFGCEAYACCQKKEADTRLNIEEGNFCWACEPLEFGFHRLKKWWFLEISCFMMQPKSNSELVLKLFTISIEGKDSKKIWQKKSPPI